MQGMEGGRAANLKGHLAEAAFVAQGHFVLGQGIGGKQLLKKGFAVALGAGGGVARAHFAGKGEGEPLFVIPFQLFFFFGSERVGNRHLVAGAASKLHRSGKGGFCTFVGLADGNFHSFDS